ncbi:helix-turn-helix domain-containing protein [uncultured Zhongshania sp.]|uniref:winged helix-turn-helix transcriptional regulator n=1 Tax=uncultured Zhongshania sp. TaxID=1642288 RepID=UPI00260062CF|nr:helix-turn-helix domain-containing protein [uncultured Zhongshania sp.]
MKPQKNGTQNSIFPDNENCSVRDVLSKLTSKWPMLILFALLDGPERFSSLQRRIENISRRMLTISLRQLERDGYIHRQVYPEVPPRVEYTLTKMGNTVTIPLIELVSWAERNHNEIRSCREKFDADK